MKRLSPEIRKALAYLEERFGIPQQVFEGWALVEVGGDIWLTSPEALEVEAVKLRRRGIRLLRAQKGGRWKLTTAGMQHLSTHIRRNVVEVGAQEAMAFVRGEDLRLSRIPESCTPGQVAVAYRGEILGSGLLSRDGRVKNQIPSGRRLPRLVIPEERRPVATEGRFNLPGGSRNS